ncbi:unnamed protein product [Brassica rapa]|uniref:Uncharacterized protein n=1 Tax=Brassica campestris TaxID=3711 RepID=A0A3P6CQI0_BRACM|nr:unnamed protein product [Brassica rapa]VDD12421.1 unnamed protein product [Brassica rapa]
MKSSHIGLICIVMISLFALRECKDNAGTVSKIEHPSCIHTECTLYSLHQDCWCCNKLIDRYKSVCWREKDTPTAKELCFAFCPKDVKPSIMELQVRLRQLIIFFFLFLTVLEHASCSRILRIAKPDRHDIAASARWLVSQNIWGVLSTLSIEHDGAPFGNVVSYSDGLPGKGKGIPYFYLTMLDPTTRNALKDSRASFAISESSIGTCKRDPMDPTCSKLTLTGKLLQLDEGSEEEKVAKKALFTKHPEMMDWPEGHEFSVFKLEIMNIFLINWYGGAKSITVDEYLRYKE